MASCLPVTGEGREEVELDSISHPLHCYFWSNNTLLFPSQAGAKSSWFVINPIGRGLRRRRGVARSVPAAVHKME